MKLKKANTESCTWDGIDSYRGWEPTGWRAAVQKRFCNIMKDKSIMCKLLVNAERKKKKKGTLTMYSKIISKSRQSLFPSSVLYSSIQGKLEIVLWKANERIMCPEHTTG